jgi:YrbI family 3-deoxy-D-manno-octulosonate 8-phosphate phosphatase
MNISCLDAIFFDFDGVLTDNRVLVDQDGKESVLCNRADGLAFELFRKINVPTFILSSEKNSVVVMRAEKLKIQVYHGIVNKERTLSKICLEKNYDLKKVMFVGNDINDLNVMMSCGYTACPSDSHKKIKNISTFKLKKEGGDGVARELIENIFCIDIANILYGSRNLD